MKEILINRGELEELKKEVQGIKSTIEILQDKAMMEEIRESEENRRQGKEIRKLNI